MSTEISVIQVRLKNGDEIEVNPFDRVYADRSCGQYDSGWVTWHPTRGEHFISDEGIVYLIGTSRVVGIAPEIKAAADKLEALYADAPDED